MRRNLLFKTSQSLRARQITSGVWLGFILICPVNRKTGLTGAWLHTDRVDKLRVYRGSAADAPECPSERRHLQTARNSEAPPTIIETGACAT